MEEGELSAVMQFYDMTFETLAALKGGTGDASGYTPATGYVTVEKSLEITTDAGYKFLMYNAAIEARGGRQYAEIRTSMAYPVKIKQCNIRTPDKGILLNMQQSANHPRTYGSRR